MGNAMIAAVEPAAAAHRERIVWFEQIVIHHQRRAFLAALGFLGNPEDAREASQEAFARAYRALHSYDVTRPFYPWYHRILRNLCFDRIAKRKRTPIPTEHVDRVTASPTSLLGRTPEASAITVDRQLRVQRAIDRLSVDHREIIYMRHYQDLSYEEMADALDVAIGTVMSRLYRARRALREILIAEESVDDV